MGFRRRDYPEVLETMLTSLAGGVSAEAHPYPPPGRTRMMLESPPARTLVSVHGTLNGDSHRFKAGTDVDLSADGSTLIWTEGGNRPDLGTLVEVNYLRRDDPAQLTDYEVGGIARTIVESVARETARLHAVMQGVYDAGFVETATGRSLDKVVALVGVERVPAGRAVAKLRFTRDPGVPGNITIPEGTRVIDTEAKVEYETTEQVTMSPAQNRISVMARDVEPGNSPVGPEVLSVLPMSIGGIIGVTNPDPASRAESAETDAELRLRARSFLQGSEKGTLGSLKAVLARQGIGGEVTEPASRPGVVSVAPVTEALSPERHAQLVKALNDARPAGVVVEMAAASAPVAVNLAIDVTTASGLVEPDRRGVHEKLREAITDYFAKLPVKEDARVNQLVGAALGIGSVEDITLRAADLQLTSGPESRLDLANGIINLANIATKLGDLSIADPALPTNVDLSIRFPSSAVVPDRTTTVAAVEAALAHLTAQATSGAAEAVRTLSFGKLLHILPAPVGDGSTLVAYDAAGTKPTLPADAGDYTVTLFVAQANGLTRVLSKAADTYIAAPSERLALKAISIEPEA